MPSKNATRKEQVIALLQEISRDYEERMRSCNLELEWEVDEKNVGAEARLFFWRRDEAGNRTNDLVDMLEFPLEQDCGEDLPLDEIATWLRRGLDEIVAANL